MLKFFKLIFFQNFFQEHYQCQMIWILIRADFLLVLTRVQTVSKGYQQTTKISASIERVKTIYAKKYLWNEQSMTLCFGYIAFWWVYDARVISKSPFLCSNRRGTMRSLYGFTGIVASTILLTSALWQILKNCKHVDTSQVDRKSPYRHCTLIMRTPQDFRKSLGPKNDRRLLR